jgi:hypothetical protein
MTPAEQLIQDYDIEVDICDDPSEFADYFRDCGSDYFECGQGFYQDEATVIVQLGDTYFNVYLEAEIGSQKMERGERFYSVENIIKVEWEVIPTPELRAKCQYSIVATLTDFDQRRLVEYFEEHNISHTIDKILI